MVEFASVCFRPLQLERAAATKVGAFLAARLPHLASTLDAAAGRVVLRTLACWWARQIRIIQCFLLTSIKSNRYTDPCQVTGVRVPALQRWPGRCLCCAMDAGSLSPYHRCAKWL